MSRSFSRGRWLSGAAIIAIATISLAFFISKNDSDSVPTASAVEERSMSPFCPGLTIAECPHGQSVSLRHEIAEKVDQGWTNSQIDEWLVANYGEAILGNPRDPTVWIAPIVIVVLGLGAVLAISRGGRGRAETLQADTLQADNLAVNSLTEDEKQTLDAEIAEFRKEYSE